MPLILLFLILFMAGVALTFLGSKIGGKGAIPFLCIGSILILIGGYGTFTALIWKHNRKDGPKCKCVQIVGMFMTNLSMQDVRGVIVEKEQEKELSRIIKSK